MKIENTSFIMGLICGAVAVFLLAYMFKDKLANLKLGKAKEIIPDVTILPVGQPVEFFPERAIPGKYYAN